MVDLPLSELLALGAGLLAAGVVTGILAGLFGIGGGGIIVPVLYQVFIFLNVPEAVRMPLAVGTSLAIIIPVSISSALAHYRKGAVDFEAVRLWWWPCMVGVGASSLVAAFAPPAVFKIAFVLTASLIGTRLLAGFRWQIADRFPGRVAMTGIGFGIGMAAALMGVAGGSFVNMAMTLYGRTMHRAVGTAAALGVFVAVPGAIGYVLAGWPQMAQLPPFSAGFVSLIGFVLIAPTSMAFAPLGARIAHRFSRRALEVSFGLFLFAVAARFIASLIWS